MYCEVTDGIQIEIEPKYIPEESDPKRQYFFFSYTVTITNLGERSARLLSRHWIIQDGTGRRRDVNGPGVVGEQPVLAPGDTFRYTSFCPLPTPTGNMRGSYQMEHCEESTGEKFNVSIPVFF